MIGNTKINLLHLSDLHCIADAKHHFEGLGKKVANCLSESSYTKPDFIVVSGDISNQNDKDGYIVAAELILDLMDALNIDEERVIITPGNHDINNKVAREVIADIIHADERFKAPNTPLSFDDVDKAIGDHIKNEATRNKILDCYKAYFSFCKRVYKKRFSENNKVDLLDFLVNTITFPEYGVKFSVLNSTWAAIGKEWLIPYAAKYKANSKWKSVKKIYRFLAKCLGVFKDLMRDDGALGVAYCMQKPFSDINLVNICVIHHAPKYFATPTFNGLLESAQEQTKFNLLDYNLLLCGHDHISPVYNPVKSYAINVYSQGRLCHIKKENRKGWWSRLTTKIGGRIIPRLKKKKQLDTSKNGSFGLITINRFTREIHNYSLELNYTTNDVKFTQNQNKLPGTLNNLPTTSALRKNLTRDNTRQIASKEETNKTDREALTNFFITPEGKKAIKPYSELFNGFRKLKSNIGSLPPQEFFVLQEYFLNRRGSSYIHSEETIEAEFIQIREADLITRNTTTYFSLIELEQHDNRYCLINVGEFLLLQKSNKPEKRTEYSDLLDKAIHKLSNADTDNHQVISIFYSNLWATDAEEARLSLLRDEDTLKLEFDRFKRQLLQDQDIFKKTVSRDLVFKKDIIFSQTRLFKKTFYLRATKFTEKAVEAEIPITNTENSLF